MSLLYTASLLLTSNAYKEGKLYSVIPSDGSGDFTFTRATTATRVNSDGLVELVPYNLLTYSEQFDNAYWNKNGGSISANSSTAPNGTTTADRLTLAATTATHGLIDFGVGGVAASTYTVSFYVKKGTHRYITIGIYRNTLNNAGAGFDLDTNTITGTGAAGTGYSASGATMTDVGDGWYRCSVVCVSGTTPMTGSCLFLRNTSYTSGAIQESWAASGTETINLWGAQLVEGTNALPYQRTETRLNIPRLDYSLGGCPSLLVEPQRTNLALQSSSFDSASWIKDAGVIVNANTSTSPSGVQDADRINFTINNRAIYRAATSTGAHTFSIYLKGEGANIGKQIQLIIGNVGGTINVTLTDQWQRFTADATSSTYVGITKVSSGQADSVLAWGAQLEVGSYATSFIPTTTASVTRNADSITRNNIFTNGLITAAGGTWFVELKNNTAYTSDSNTGSISLDTSNFGFTNGFSIRKLTSNRIRLYSYASTVSSVLYQTITDNVKIAIKWNGSTADVFVNGVKQVSSAPFTITNMQFLSNNTTPFLAYISSMLLAPTPLTDDECIQLTTL